MSTMQTSRPTHLIVNDLGRVGYANAVAWQHRVHRQVRNATAPQTLLLAEHDPVITVSRRHSATEHVLADAEQLANLGIDVQPTDRGGDVTYHGPGQLVAYPILRLAALRLNISQYMRLLEQVVIDCVAVFGICGYRRKGFTGVWVDRVWPPGQAKVCAMGVRVRHQVTMHGLALNITTQLEHFQTIMPCGLAAGSVTSLQELLGHRTPTMADVKSQLTASMRHRLVQLNRRQPVFVS